jgi:hypothetical protein
MICKESVWGQFLWNAKCSMDKRLGKRSTNKIDAEREEPKNVAANDKNR